MGTDTDRRYMCCGSFWTAMYQPYQVSLSTSLKFSISWQKNFAVIIVVLEHILLSWGTSTSYCSIQKLILTVFRNIIFQKTLGSVNQVKI